MFTLRGSYLILGCPQRCSYGEPCPFIRRTPDNGVPRYVFPMFSQWFSCDFPVVVLWVPVVSLCFFQYVSCVCVPIVFLCFLMDSDGSVCFSMVFICFVYGCYGSPCFSCVFPMLFLWIPMVAMCSSYDFLMFFKRFSYVCPLLVVYLSCVCSDVFLMLCHCFPYVITICFSACS